MVFRREKEAWFYAIPMVLVRYITLSETGDKNAGDEIEVPYLTLIFHRLEK